MSKTARVQVRISPETKEKAEALFDSLGLSTSDAIRLFICKALREGDLPFHISEIPSGSKTGTKEKEEKL